MNSVTSAQRREASFLDDPGASAPKGIATNLLERAGRAAARDRFEALAETGVTHPDPCDGGDDPDLCGRDSIPHAVLFLKEDGDPSAVDRADVNQAELGDCHLMAPLAALAATPAGRALIESAISENKDAKGAVVSYTVTLHEPDPHLLTPPTFTTLRLTVDGRFGVPHAKPRSAGDEREVWPLVIEKAFAQYAGGYTKLAMPSSPARAMEALTGKPAVDILLGTAPGYSEGQLQQDLAAGKLLVLLTKSSVPGDAPRGIIAKHAYQVAGVDASGSRLWVELHNPWNIKDKQPAKAPFDLLPRWFAAIDVGTVK